MSKQPGMTEDDHVRGGSDAVVTLIEYGDFQCPYCARAHAALGELQRQHGKRLRLVYRHLPLSSLHPLAQPLAEAAEAAGAQGKFWEMHDALFENQGMLDEDALPALAGAMGIDGGRFRDDFESGRYRDKVLAQAEEGRAMGASGTPSFFINGERYHGDSDHASLAQAIEQALKGR